MREDMARVLVGNARIGTRERLKRRKLHQGQGRDPENTLEREPMSRGRGTKFLNENLAPLESYLRSQVGRPWNSVYSEISERLQPTNAVQQHVRDHLKDFVVIHTWFEGEQIIGLRRSGKPIALQQAQRWATFYVDPRSGLLRACKEQRLRNTYYVPDLDVRWDGAWRQLRRVDGVWYELRLERIPRDARQHRWLRDQFFREDLENLLRRPPGLLFETYGRGEVFAAEKRQLSKRELRRLDSLPAGRKPRNNHVA